VLCPHRVYPGVKRVRKRVRQKDTDKYITRKVVMRAMRNNRAGRKKRMRHQHEGCRLSGKVLWIMPGKAFEQRPHVGASRLRGQEVMEDGSHIRQTPVPNRITWEALKNLNSRFN
jgi:hypothetical protein